MRKEGCKMVLWALGMLVTLPDKFFFCISLAQRSQKIRQNLCQVASALGDRLGSVLMLNIQGGVYTLSGIFVLIALGAVL
jgi:hypothetical protein